ncbi:MAG: hypothetical protein MnENMB40S_15340 [Rhizobiaceae bacterium MnEN-MB40S]|nr:MAG: hypothetical protein MnENMB40S_15340 [Rhizobiaceae bacterium MnEN-MB40S]
MLQLPDAEDVVVPRQPEVVLSLVHAPASMTVVAVARAAIAARVVILDMIVSLISDQRRVAMI